MPWTDRRDFPWELMQDVEAGFLEVLDFGEHQRLGESCRNMKCRLHESAIAYHVITVVSAVDESLVGGGADVTWVAIRRRC